MARRSSNAPAFLNLTRIQKQVDRRDYEHAIAALRQLRQSTSSDEVCRLLGRCLADTGVHVEALRELAAIRDTQPRDHLLIGRCHFQAGDLKRAEDSFMRLIELSPEDPVGHYWLGMVFDRAKGQVKHAEESAVASYRRAIACEGCPVDAYFRLAEHLPRTPEGTQEKVGVLKDALARHPNSERVQLSLIRLYCDEVKQPGQTMERLGPFLGGAGPSAASLWRATCVYRDLKEFGKAKDILSLISSVDIDETCRAQVRGDIEMREGRFQEAEQTFAAAMSTADPTRRWLLGFARVAALWGAESTGVGIDEAREAAFSYLELIDDACTVDNFVKVGSDLQYFCQTRPVITVCTRLLQDESLVGRERVDDEMRGALMFVLLRVSTDDDEGARGELLLRAASVLDHPAMSPDLEVLFLAKRDYAAAFKHHLKWCRWLIQKGKDPSEVSTHDASFPIGYEDTRPRTVEECTSLVAAFGGELRQVRDPGEIQLLFLPAYKSLRPTLRENKRYSELLSLATSLIEAVPDDLDLLWDRAYSSDCLGRKAEAEVWYRRLIDIDTKNCSAMHNLSLLVHDRGDIDEAITWAQKAKVLSPGDADVKKWHSSLRKKKERDAQREDYLRTAALRWPKLDHYKRQLAGALRMISSYNGLRHLAELTGMDERYLGGHLRALEEAGIVLYDKNGRYFLNPHILSLIDRENEHAIVTKIVHGDEAIAFRPVFSSLQERLVYSVLVGLFPNHLVFPNMALQTIFSFDKMKAKLDEEVFAFMLKSQVDVCVISTVNYLPLIGFEVDSRFHDGDVQKRRDEKKDRIFKTGGVPLLRIRGYGRPTPGALRSQIVKEVTSLGKAIRTQGAKSAVLSTIERELDFDSFGSDVSDDDPGRWLTVTDAATFVGIAAGVISRAVDANELKGNGLSGRDRRVDTIDLVRWHRGRASRHAEQESDTQVAKLVAKHVRD